jgi:hypothetical protein
MDLIEGTLCYKPGPNRPGPGFHGTSIIETVRKWNRWQHYMTMKRRQSILRMLHSVYAVLGVCYTHCMLYSVYAVLSVCLYWVSTHDQGMER